MSYPKQLITSLCDQLQDTLTDFFNVEQRKYFSEYTDINSMVSDSLPVSEVAGIRKLDED